MTFGSLAFFFKFFNPILFSKWHSLFCFFAAGAMYTSHLAVIASNYQLMRMAGKLHLRANKVAGTKRLIIYIGTHAVAKFFCLKFSQLKRVFEFVLLLYELDTLETAAAI